MSLFVLSLQVFGPLEVLEGLAPLVTQHVATLRRAGERIGRTSTLATSDVLNVEFGEWNPSEGDEEATFAKEQAILEATRLELLRLPPALASLDRRDVEARLWLSAIRMEEQGGSSVPRSS